MIQVVAKIAPDDARNFQECSNEQNIMGIVLGKLLLPLNE